VQRPSVGLPPGIPHLLIYRSPRRRLIEIDLVGRIARQFQDNFGIWRLIGLRSFQGGLKLSSEAALRNLGFYGELFPSLTILPFTFRYL